MNQTAKIAEQKAQADRKKRDRLPKLLTIKKSGKTGVTSRQ